MASQQKNNQDNKGQQEIHLKNNTTSKDICKICRTKIDLEITKQKMIDDIICETNEKLCAIAEEMKSIKFSSLDDASKDAKLEVLRQEFQKMLDEQQRKVLEITKDKD